MARSKYHTRPDGRKIATKTYDGKQHCFYGKTDAEIDRKIKEYEANRNRKQSKSFGAIADAYWEDKQKDLAANTLHGYTKAIERARAVWEDEPIGDICSRDIYNLLLKLKAEGYSQKVISNTKSVLKGIFDYAFVLGDIDGNPCASIPQVKGAAKVPRQPASEDDIKKIERFKTESLTSRLFYFILYTGARIGEASALQWKDIDIESRTAIVSKTLSYGNKSQPFIKDCPKTEAGKRQLQLLDNVIEILPKRGKPDDYVFFPDGLPRRRAFDVAIKNFEKKHDLQCTPHQLRHSYTTMLYSSGVDVKTAQLLLGHSSVQMTLDVYTHEDRKHTESVRAGLNEYVAEKIKKETAPEAPELSLPKEKRGVINEPTTKESIKSIS